VTENALSADQLLLRFRDDAQLLPYCVFSAGRSRTMWLSAFLTYGVCVCNFEVTAKVANFGAVCELLQIPGMGAAETLAAPAWPLLLTAEPRLRVVVVRRPIEEILDSLVAATTGKLEFDRNVMRRLVAYVMRALDRLSCQPGVLTVDYHELEREDTCRAVFEHCLPYKHDSGWWNWLAARNVQPDLLALAQLYQLREQEIKSLGRECRHLLFRLARQGHLAQFERGASARMEAH
jgi:hypothetical protein